MTVITVVTKADGFVFEGETHEFHNITKIVDKGDVVELIGKVGYAGVLNKEYHKIISVKY